MYTIWRNCVLCFHDFALLRQKGSAQTTIMGYLGCGVQSECSLKEQRQEANHLQRTFFPEGKH